MKIVIDLDQTIFDCDSYIYKLANSFFSGKFKKKLKSSEVSSNLGENKSVKLNKMQSADYYYELENSVEIIKKWFNLGDEIIFLSSRPNFKSLNAAFLDWMQRFEVPYHKLCVACTNKTLFSQKEKADLMIDNNYRVCRHAYDKKVDVIFYNPFDKKVEDDFLSASSWNEIDQLVDSLRENLTCGA